MPKPRRPDRPEVKQALALMRSSVGFILIVDVPFPDRAKVEDAIRRGERPPSQLRLFATEEFRPARKTAATLGVVARTLYGRLEMSGQADPPQERMGLPVDFGLAKSNGHSSGQRSLRHIVFGADGDYGDRLHLMAVSEEVPAGATPGQGTSSVVCSIEFPKGTDHAKDNFPALEEWATSQVEQVAKHTQWPGEEVREMVSLSLVQLRKAWEQEPA